MKEAQQCTDQRNKEPLIGKRFIAERTSENSKYRLPGKADLSYPCYVGFLCRCTRSFMYKEVAYKKIVLDCPRSY